MKNKKKLIIISSVIITGVIACVVTLLIINNNQKDNSNYKEEPIIKEEKNINFVLREITILEDEEYTIDAFIDKDSSDSNLTYSFESEEMSSYKEVGEYTIKIVATDDSNNKTVKETKLIIKKKEVNNETSNQTQEKSSTSNNSRKTNNSTKQNTTSTNNNTQSQTTTQTPSSQPAQDLYYSSLAPKGTANPLYMLDASQETLDKIFSLMQQDVRIFNAQGPTVATDTMPIPWSKTNDYVYPDGYTYEINIINCKQTSSAYVGDINNKPEVTNPTYNTYVYQQYSGASCDRIIGKYYYTDTNGSKVWKWNPNNLHF